MTGPRIVGLLPAGVSDSVAKQVAVKVGEAFMRTDGSTVRALRIVPSSLVSHGETVEFVANTTVEPMRSRPEAPAGRSKVIDSVVTLDANGSVKGVRIPFLEAEPI